MNGRCLCGAVHFVVEDAFLYAAYCHCSRCRRRSGAAFTVFGGIEIDKVRLVRGEDDVLIHEESAEGYLCKCKRCFSPLYSAVRAREYMHVQLGALTDTPTLRPNHHIHVASKAPWYQICDDLPQYAELPP